MNVEQTTVYLPNGKPVSVGVPVLGPQGRDINDLIAERNAGKRGRKPGPIVCAICQQGAGTLVRVEHPQTKQAAYVHANCDKDVAAQRMNRIAKQLRQTERLLTSRKRQRKPWKSK